MSQEYKIPVWEYNNEKFEFDFDDAESMNRYYKAFEIMKNESFVISKDTRRDDFIKNYCTIYFRVFDNIFGEGTSDKLFKGKVHVRLCENAYESFIAFVKKNVATSDQHITSFLNSFSKETTRPQGNKKPQGTGSKPRNKKKSHYYN